MMNMYRLLLVSGICFILNLTALAADFYKTQNDISYRPQAGEKLDDYAKQRCVLDIYNPADKTGFATVVWLRGGEKSIPQELKGQGIAVVAANYRLSPNFISLYLSGIVIKSIVKSGKSAQNYTQIVMQLHKKFAHNVFFDILITYGKKTTQKQ